MSGQTLKEELMRLCNKPPESVVNGSIQLTRQWLSARQAALKVLKKPGVTAAELLAAINSLKG